MKSGSLGGTFFENSLGQLSLETVLENNRGKSPLGSLLGNYLNKLVRRDVFDNSLGTLFKKLFRETLLGHYLGVSWVATAMTTTLKYFQKAKDTTSRDETY